MIETHDLRKEFQLGDNRVVALAGIDISISRGDFVAVMGPSGSGKSTFMNMIGCLDSPSGGSYRLDGQDVAGLNDDARADLRNRLLGFVFQNFNLLPRTTALDNVALPLLYRHRVALPTAQRHALAAQRLAEVGLSQRADHQPAQLSGGQQQRVAIARALVNNPALLLADEPTGALDSRTSVEIMALFQALNARGITIVVVTHEPDIAAYARRRLLFRDGRLVQDSIVERPRDAVAELAALPEPVA
ncbi:MAG: ABC transporter ATP-binding protein [Ferrovibrio sp.]|nr:ABC transporter ATP-binding protein [Ferrovibrio sp.]